MKSIVKRPWIWVVVGVALLGALLALRPLTDLASPSEAAPQPAIVEPATISEAALEVARAAVQETPAPASPDSEAQTVADMPSSDNCIACHTNQALLEQIAEEPEEVVSELAAGEG